MLPRISKNLAGFSNPPKVKDESFSSNWPNFSQNIQDWKTRLGSLSSVIRENILNFKTSK